MHSTQKYYMILFCKQNKTKWNKTKNIFFFLTHIWICNKKYTRKNSLASLSGEPIHGLAYLMGEEIGIQICSYQPDMNLNNVSNILPAVADIKVSPDSSPAPAVTVYFTLLIGLPHSHNSNPLLNRTENQRKTHRPAPAVRHPAPHGWTPAHTAPVPMHLLPTALLKMFDKSGPCTTILILLAG